MKTITFRLSLLVIFILPWENIINVSGIGTLSRVMGLLLGAAWVINLMAAGHIRRPRLFHVVIFLFVLWNIISILWSIDVEETLSTITTYVQLFVMVLIIWDLYTTRAAVQAGLQAYVLGAYVSVASILANQLSGSTALWERYSATGFQVDDIGVILALGLPVAWHLATSENHSRAWPILKIVNFAYVPAAILGIALTSTRTALIASLPAILFGLSSLTRLKLVARVLIFGALAWALFALQAYIPETSISRLSTTQSEISGGDLNGRLEIWQAGLRAAADQPLVGYGAGAFRSAVRTGRPGHDKVAHNSFLSILVQLGLIGFGMFAFLVLNAGLQTRHLPRWDAIFWLTLLLVWAIGAFALSWEARKQTWLFLSLVVASASVLDPSRVLSSQSEFSGAGPARLGWRNPAPPPPQGAASWKSAQPHRLTSGQVSQGWSSLSRDHDH